MCTHEFMLSALASTRDAVGEREWPAREAERGYFEQKHGFRQLQTPKHDTQQPKPRKRIDYMSKHVVRPFNGRRGDIWAERANAALISGCAKQ